MSFLPAQSHAASAGAGRPQNGVWRVVKTYDHAEGLSCCFRQWQAGHSHCRYIHGYALAFRFTFLAGSLDDRGWCIDFGGLKPLRAWLHETFDHTMLAAADDPELPTLRQLAAQGLIQLRVVPAVGCEAFAAHTHAWAHAFAQAETSGRVHVEQVEVAEHAGNAAVFWAGG